MRLFLVLCCSLAAIAHAKPQGYNYGTGISGGSATVGHYQSSGLNGVGGLNAPIGGGSSSYGGFGSASSSAPSFGNYQVGSSGGSSGGFGSSVGGGFSGIGSGIGGSSYTAGFGGRQQSAGFEAPLVHKQFISFSAPEDHESLEQSKHFVIGRPQKNYRVVFIKAPSSSAANVKLSAEYAPQEEKTVIYVLSKKDSTLEVNDIATPAPTVPAKPEVFFIKYKTEEEAHHAQQQIQAEYDKIQGTSEHTNGGVGQQQSVVGILDGGVGAASGSHGISGDIGGSSYGSGSGASIGGISGSGFVGASSTNIGVSQSGSSDAKSSTYLPPSKVV